jgi:hypothetical protein
MGNFLNNFQLNKFPWEAKLQFMTRAILLCYRKWNVDIKVFILTVVENSGICKFNRIYFIEFENINHLSNVLKLPWRFATQWNLLHVCWKYKIQKFYFAYKHKIHEFVIFNQTTKFDAHEEKYFHSKCQTQEYQHIYF